MKNDPYDGLPNRDRIEEELRQMAEETPETPADFHAGWMRAVEAEIMNNETENITNETNSTQTPKTKKQFHWKRWTAIAAAAVILIGGTAATRDILVPRKTSSYNSAGSTGSSYKTYDTEPAMGYSANTYAETSYVTADAEEAVYAESAMNGAASSTAVGGSAEPQVVKDPLSKIIRTVSMTLATQHYDLCVESFRTSCMNLGGWIESANEGTSTGNLRNGDFTFRIPAGNLDTFLAALPGDSYRVIRSNESATDVSESYYDTKTRLESQKMLLERLQNMVTEAAELSDLLTLEREIADTQYRIDSYQGSLNSTDAKVNYATVRITLREETEAAKVEYKELSFGERLSASLLNGFESFGDFLEDMALFLAEILPLILIIAVIVVAVILIRKSVKKKKNNQ